MMLDRFCKAEKGIGLTGAAVMLASNRRRQGYGGQEGRTDAVLKTDAAIYVIEFKLGTPEEALAQIKAKRYYEPYLADPRPVVLLGAGGFVERTIRCLWEEIDRRPQTLDTCQFDPDSDPDFDFDLRSQLLR